MILRGRLMAWAKGFLQEARDDGLHEVINAYGIGEVNTTLLLDALLYESGLLPIDQLEAIVEDETHIVHDVVIDAAEWYEREY